MSLTAPAPREVIYPESDGQPIAENTLQFRWLTTIKYGLDAMFKDDPDVFVAGDLLWYPVEGDPTTRAAPDVMVAVGRPKGERGSYLQWKEGGIPPQVVFEVMSPGNTPAEMRRKLRFYDRYGVEEYYIYDPDHQTLEGWRRTGGGLRPIEDFAAWISPRLGIRLELGTDGLLVYGPDGEPVVTYLELLEQRNEGRRQIESERREKERERQEKQRERQRAERLAAQLRALGIEPEA